MFKELIPILSVYSGFNSLWGFKSRKNNRSIVLAYHRVVNADEQLDDPTQKNVDDVYFKRQIDILAKTHKPILIDDLIREGKWNEPVFAVTFDDGYGDNYRVAYPILKERGIPATVFIATDAVAGRNWLWWDLLLFILRENMGKQFTFDGVSYSLNNLQDLNSAQAKISSALKRSETRDTQIEQLAQETGLQIKNPQQDLYLNWDQAKELVNAGWTLGGHTSSHQILTQIPVEKANQEIIESTNEIKEKTGYKPVVFAYPNGREGDYNEEIIKILKKNDYIGALLADGALNSLNIDPFRIPRTAPKLEPISLYKMKLTGLYYSLKKILK